MKGGEGKGGVKGKGKGVRGKRGEVEFSMLLPVVSGRNGK
jgi:hypothetical protein